MNPEEAYEETFEDGRVQVSSMYRVYGSGDDDRILLLDLEHSDAVWVDLEASDTSEQQHIVDNLYPGNVVEAAVVGDPTSEELWELVNIEVVERSMVIFVKTKEYVPGPADEAWQERDKDTDVGIDFLEGDNGPVIELEVHPDTDGNGEDVFQQMRHAQITLESWFEETPAFEHGAKNVIVVNPERRPYIALLFFPKEDEGAFDDARRELKDNLDV